MMAHFFRKSQGVDYLRVPPFFYMFFCMFFMGAVFLSPTIGYAACTNPDGVTGDIIYNGPYDNFQGCTSEGWKAFHKPRSTPLPFPPTGCPNIGDVCTGVNAGMIYAADFEGHKLYIAGGDAVNPPNDTIRWAPSENLSGMDLCVSPFTAPTCKTGKANTEYLKNHATTYAAAEYCAGLSAHGYGVGEWYLPSRNEFIAIHNSLRDIGKLASSNFVGGGDYWSSSESHQYYAWVLHIGTSTSEMSKNTYYRVRCAYR